MPFFRPSTTSTAYGGSTSTVPSYYVQADRKYPSSSYGYSSASSNCSDAGSLLISEPACLQSCKSLNVYDGGYGSHSSASSVKSGKSLKQKLFGILPGNRTPATPSSRRRAFPPVPKLSKAYVKAMVGRAPSPLSPVTTTMHEEDENNPTPRRCQTSMSGRMPSSQSNSSIFSYACAVQGQPSQPSLCPQLTIQHSLPRPPPQASQGYQDSKVADEGLTSNSAARTSHQRHGSMPAASELSRLSVNQNSVFTPKRYGGIGSLPSHPPRGRSSSFDPSYLKLQCSLSSPSIYSAMSSRPSSPESTVSTPFRIRRKPVPSLQVVPVKKRPDGEDTDVSSLDSPVLGNVKIHPPMEEKLDKSIGCAVDEARAPSPDPEISFQHELDVLFEELLDACQNLVTRSAPSSPAARSTPLKNSASVPLIPTKMPMLTPPSRRSRSRSPTPSVGRARSATCSTLETNGPVTPVDKVKSAARPRKSSDRHLFSGRVEQLTPHKTPKSSKSARTNGPVTPSRVRHQIRQIERIVSAQASPESSSRISTPLRALEAILDRPCVTNSVELTREVKAMMEDARRRRASRATRL